MSVDLDTITQYFEKIFSSLDEQLYSMNSLKSVYMKLKQDYSTFETEIKDLVTAIKNNDKKAVDVLIMHIDEM